MLDSDQMLWQIAQDVSAIKVKLDSAAQNFSKVDIRLESIEKDVEIFHRRMAWFKGIYATLLTFQAALIGFFKF